MNSASPKPATANKKNVPQAGNPPVLVQCSGLCGRTGGIDGVVLKFCSGVSADFLMPLPCEGLVLKYGFLV